MAESEVGECIITTSEYSKAPTMVLVTDGFIFPLHLERFNWVFMPQSLDAE
jgi:hypothetical protein